MVKSDTLFVIIGSHNKNPGGNAAYTDELSITTLLKPETRVDLLKTRHDIFDLIMDGKIISDGQNLKDLNTKIKLVRGNDLRDNQPGGLYLPAYMRFTGRLYTTITPRDLLIHGNHHVLILTGLYGLTTPEELIQNHEIDVNHDPIIKKIWKIHNILTNVLSEYIEVHHIQKVFDLTANDGYRRLIKWEQLAKPEVNIYHCYCNDRYGDSQLMAFAKLVQEWQDPTHPLNIPFPDALLTSQNPLKIPIQDTVITVTNSDEPPDGVQRYEKISSLYKYNMYLLLMASEIERFLKKMSDNKNIPIIDNQNRFNSNIVQGWFIGGDTKIWESIKEIRDRRNDLAHGISIEYFISDEEYLELHRQYLDIVEYAKKMGISMPDKPPFIQE
jgi:cytoplasmic iron level regulating protein YaaA (DUF328/UPF0246 family)